MKTRSIFLLLLVLSFAVTITACNKDDNPQRIKRTLVVKPIDTKYVELHDGTRYGMGENIYNRLISKLEETKKFVLIVDENDIGEIDQGLLDEKQEDDRLRFQFKPIPAAKFSTNISGMTYIQGSRGVRRANGFLSSFQTNWNDGSFAGRNEFDRRPLIDDRSWFGQTFAEIGEGNDSTIAGIDAGEQGEMNLILFSMHYRRKQFQANTYLDTNLNLIDQNIVKAQTIHALGTGFIFAFGVSLLELDISFRLNRKTALQETFDRSVDQIVSYLSESLQKLPLRTKVEIISPAEGIIINAGRREGLRKGDIFYHKAAGRITRLKVTEAFYIGSIVKPQTRSSDIQTGDTLILDEYASEEQYYNELYEYVDDEKEKREVEEVWQRLAKTITKITAANVPENRIASVSAPLLANSTSANDSANPKVIKEKTQELIVEGPELEFSDKGKNALAQKESITLPGLILRYFQYDQKLEKEITQFPTFDAKAKRNSWNLAAIGLPQATIPANLNNIQMAIIDSGVDYNHKNLHHAFSREYAGLDYFSFDSRSFDDNSHGTAIAGIIAAKGIRDEPIGIAPDVRLMSYKVFNPWGETTSAALYKATEKAIEDGAKIIVMAWATTKRSQALQAALDLAAENNVLVITAAGDEGENLNDKPYYPAAYLEHSNLIRVASLNRSGKISQKLRRYSNYGNNVVDIAAPGEDIKVLAPRSEYLTRSGSDLAAAHVAGVAALVAAGNPDWNATQIRQHILATAVERSELHNYIRNGKVLNAATALPSLRLSYNRN